MRKIREKPKLHNRHQKAYAVEDWQNSQTASDSGLHRNPPTKASYEQHFLAKMDKRSRAYVLLKQSFDEITADRGGADTLSHVQLTLIERFCFLEYILRLRELQMAEPGSNSERDKHIGSWVQSLNALVGLGKAIGLERRARQVTSLQTYIKRKKNERE